MSIIDNLLGENAEERADSFTGFFGFDRLPFENNWDPEFFFIGGQYKPTVLDLLDGVKRRRGILLLTGPAGTGKTASGLVLSRLLGRNSRTVYVDHPFQDAAELFRIILQGLGSEENPATPLAAVELIRAAAAEVDSEDDRLLVVIDDAQLLGTAQLEALLQVNSIRTEMGHLVQLLILGRPELVERWTRPEMAEFNHRTGLRLDLEPLSEELGREYLVHRLECAGGELDLLPPEVVELITHLAGGNPRSLNSLADSTLRRAYRDDRRNARAEDVLAAAKGLGLDVREASRVVAEWRAEEADRETAEEPVPSPDPFSPDPPEPVAPEPAPPAGSAPDPFSPEPEPSAAAPDPFTPPPEPEPSGPELAGPEDPEPRTEPEAEEEGFQPPPPEPEVDEPPPPRPTGDDETVFGADPEAAPGPPRPARENRLTGNVDLVAGAPITLRAGEARSTLVGEVVGFVEDEFILINTRKLTPEQRKTIKSGLLGVQYVNGGYEFQFPARMLHYADTPAALLSITYPERVEIKDLRNRRRINCCLSTNFIQGENRIYGMVTNLSQGGCRVVLRRDLNARAMDILIGEEARVTLVPDPSQESLELTGTVRNKDHDRLLVILGIGFEPDGQTEALTEIERFVDMALDHSLAAEGSASEENKER